MSADHRKPVVAFVVLALAAAAIVGIQRAEAQAGRFLATVIGTGVRGQGTLAADVPGVGEAIRTAAFGPRFSSLDRALRGDRSEPSEVSPPAERTHLADEPAGRAAEAGPGRSDERRGGPKAYRAADDRDRADVRRPSPARNAGQPSTGNADTRDAVPSEQPRMMSRTAAEGQALGGANLSDQAAPRLDTDRADRAARRAHQRRAAQRGWASVGFAPSRTASR